MNAKRFAGGLPIWITMKMRTRFFELNSQKGVSFLYLSLFSKLQECTGTGFWFTIILHTNFEKLRFLIKTTYQKSCRQTHQTTTPRITNTNEMCVHSKKQNKKMPKLYTP